LARKAPYKPVNFSAGPFTGMCDTPEIAASDPSKAYYIQNCYPVPGGGGLTGRPGFALVGGSDAGTRGQGSTDFVKWDGTRYTVVIYSGEIYTVDWSSGSTGTLNRVVTTANLTTATITLNGTARVSMVPFNNVLVISDGVNVPFTWTGATGAGGLTLLTNCPVLYGPPTVYYGKLFGIKNAARQTFVWSEENDPTTGYEAGGFNNAWDFTQNDAEPLTRLLGTNEALYVFREDSVAVVSGAVDTEFTTTGTRAGVSEAVGTTAPWSVIYSRSTVFFMDRAGKPHMIRAGGEAVPIWQDFRETIKTTILPSDLAKAVAVDFAPANLILFGYVVSGDTYPSRFLVYNFDGPDPIAAAIWKGYEFEFVSMAYATQLSVPRLFHIHPTSGFVYIHGHTNTQTWDDFKPSSVAIQHVVETMAMGGDIAGELYFDRVDWGLRADATAMTNVYSYTTNRGASSSQSPGSGAVAHKALGINAHARWIRVKVTHETIGEEFGLERVRVRGVVTTDSPGTI
jgi:hypothetical protein